jgi:UDP-glucuronate 4-epimerase
VDSNIVGTFNVMEIARERGVKHLLLASTSSVYGANEKMPFAEGDRAPWPLTLYAATKRATEHMSHAYSHLWDLPTTVFRFFSVYGPWGRPDMALYKFVAGILGGTPIDVYNNGQMERDFTYVGDLVEAISRLIPAMPQRGRPAAAGDSLSPVAPWRVVNIGRGGPVNLMDFIKEIERRLGKPADIHFMPMQPGDVSCTFANADLLENLTGYRPTTPIEVGVSAFCDWYKEYHGLS